MEAKLMNNPVAVPAKASTLHQIARHYVLEGLGKKNFDAIPYADEVVLRAPLSPGGSANPLHGKENLRTSWWAPLPDLLGKVRVLDTYVNQDLTAVNVEFTCEILLNPPVQLRIIDRFKVNAAGKITDQENFFDPRAVTNPS